MINEKLVGENDKYKFYKNSLCGIYKGYGILLAENKKTKERTYIITESNKAIGESSRIEDIYCKIDILKLAKEM